MKIKLTIVALLAFIINSCTIPRFLPEADEIDVNQNGSHIMILLKKGDVISGELLAVDNNQLIILRESNRNSSNLHESDSNFSKTPVVIPMNELYRFQLRYAQPKNYSWTIPIGILLPLIPVPEPDSRSGDNMPFHGYYSILTIPTNLIVTITFTLIGKNAYRYNEKKITNDKLRMFARFPQGIPPDIDITSIK